MGGGARRGVTIYIYIHIYICGLCENCVLEVFIQSDQKACHKSSRVEELRLVAKTSFYHERISV